MNTIWKVQLVPEDCQKIYLPHGATIISAHNQRDNICLWAEVKTDGTVQAERTIRVFGTGHPISVALKNLLFIGTVILQDGDLVFHVYEQV